MPILHYYYCNQEGGNLHIVSKYSSYTKEDGLKGKYEELESTRAHELIKWLSNQITKEQKITLKTEMKSGSFGVIIHLDGNTSKY